MIYQYLRCSSFKQADSGLGLTTQSLSCTRAGDAIIAKTGDSWATTHFGDAKKESQYVDAAVSGYRIPFEKRPAGKELLSVLKHGDIVIVHRICRLCRSIKDYVRIVQLFADKGVRLIVITPRMDLGTAIGRATVTICATMAEFESARKGERIRAALAARKRNGVERRVDSILRAMSGKAESLPSDYRPKPRADIASDITKPGNVYIYARVSHRTSTDSGLGILAQLNASQDYAKDLLEQCPHLKMGDAFCDTSVSAYSKTLAERPEGERLYNALKEGDHILCYSMDRVFRNTKEMLSLTDEWRRSGITAHFISEGFDMSSPEGRLVATVSASLAEMEAAMCSARAKEIRSLLASSGRYAGGIAVPPLWRMYRFSGKRILVLDRYQIVTCRLIRWLNHRHKQKLPGGLPIHKACQRVEDLLAKREGRKSIPVSGVLARWATKHKLDQKRFAPSPNGYVYPLWTPKRFAIANERWEETIDMWRAQKQKHRDMLTRMSIKDLLPTRMTVAKKRRHSFPKQPSIT